MAVILWVLVLITAAVSLAWWLSALPGTVVVTLAGTTIETATPLALVAVVLLVLLLLGVLSLLAWLFGSPRRFGRWSGRRQRGRGDLAVTRTLTALAAGEQSTARKEAKRARVALGDTPQTLLLAAEAERLSGDDAAAATLYNTMAERDDSGLLGLRGLFRQAINRQDYDGAAEIARRADRVHPGGNWLREERAALAVRAGDWRQAQALAGPGAPLATYAVAAAEAASDLDDGLRLARAAYKAHPDFSPAALAYARRLRAAGRDVKAMDVLREVWARAPTADVAAYALEPETDPQARLRRGNRLAAGNSDHLETHLLLARLLLDADLPAEARRHLEVARERGEQQRRYWLLLADLEGIERGDTEIGRLAQRDALRHAADAQGDAAWHCEQCGTALDGWRATCPHCGITGRVQWGSGRETSLLPMELTPAATGLLT